MTTSAAPSGVTSRRHQTRNRLIESAVLVLGRRSADASIIDELIQIAGVSRGTYYNYFKDSEALLREVAEATSDELIRLVDPEIRGLSDPAARVSAGVRRVLRVARTHPHFVRFVARVGPAALGSGSLAAQVVPRDLALGLSGGRFRAVSPRLAFDLVTGPVLAAFNTLQYSVVDLEYIDALAEGVLRALGVTGGEARRIARKPLDVPALPPDSLIVRAELRARHSDPSH